MNTTSCRQSVTQTDTLKRLREVSREIRALVEMDGPVQILLKNNIAEDEPAQSTRNIIPERNKRK